MPNKSYQKGYRFEAAIKDAIGRDCSRSHMSGAYTGECDLKFTIAGKVYRGSCKVKADGFKTDYAQLETNDILFKRSDRNVALVTMKFHDWLALVELADKIE